MKIIVVLVDVWAILFMVVKITSGQNGEFEGSGETGLGDDRLVSFAGDAKLNFPIWVASTFGTTQTSTAARTFTPKTTTCLFLSLPILGMKFYGTEYRRLYVCPNGCVRFKNNEYQTNPRNFGTYRGQADDPSLAPYWSFVDLDSFSNGQSKVFFKRYEERTQSTDLFGKTDGYGNKILNRQNYQAQWVMIITWENLRPNNPGTYEGRNTFQLLLANGIDNKAIAVYIYKDVDWSVGVPLVDYRYYTNANYLPVVGWNSGKSDLITPYWNVPNSGRTKIQEIDDYFGPVLNTRGEIGIDLNDVSKPPTSVDRCRNWVSAQIFRGTVRSSCDRPCAPSLGLARIHLSYYGRWWGLRKRFKRSFYRFFPTYCVFSSYWKRLNGRWLLGNDADECCYYRFFDFLVTSPLPGASRWHAYHPERDFFKYLLEENAYNDCCVHEESTPESCWLFYSVRPTCNSFGYRFSARWAYSFGDPHFVSLDGKNYTFNGCGWFTYFKGKIPGFNESSLVVQVRTTRVGDVNATGFTALTVQEGLSEVIQVNLSPSGGLIVKVGGADFSLTENSSQLDSGVTLSYINNTFSIGTLEGNGIRINKAANGTFLTFVTAFSDSYQNSSLGLAGNWNGNIEDDFTLPNGTVLPIDMSDSEIFYKFGEAWRVPDNEKIYENIDDDHPNYKCPDNFVPIFYDEALDALDPELKKKADQVCGNDVNCLFDIAATNNLAIGQSTLAESTTINNEISIAANNPPVFTQNVSVIDVTFGETFTLSLEAEDPDGNDIQFDVPSIPPGATFNYTGNRLYFTWTVDSTSESNLTFLVEDTFNASTTMSPTIRLCRCANGGECFVPEATSAQTAAIQTTFLIKSCRCPLGKIGQFCEDERDFCQGGSTPPCHPLVECFNHPTNFSCGPCPTGYEGNGQVCQDEDECKEGGSNDCEQSCVNSVASYSCQCFSGFTLNVDGKTCNDIDECSLANDCSQLCNNTIGSYNCFCRIGFKINPKDTRSCIAQTKCDPSNDCEHICYIDPLNPGQQKCECRLGYTLGANQKSCEDVNECENTQSNLCAQICTNNLGSYTCSCLSGYRNDSVTACSDIDECFEGTSNCTGVGEECENIAGSYTCGCSKRLNMIRVNGTCIFKEDESIKSDLAAAPPAASDNQSANAIQITVKNFQEDNYTVDANALFKRSVVTLLNDFCNANLLRPQDCGISQNQLYFNELSVERLPSYPSNLGENAVIQFYVDYPDIVGGGSLPQAILASIVSANLQRFRVLTGWDIALDTSVTPPAPANPSDEQRNNAVVLKILSFTTNEWTTFFDIVFRRTIAVALNRYCEKDLYKRTTDCGLSGSDTFDLDKVARLPGSPAISGSDVTLSFYVTNPSTRNPVRQNTLASILLTRETIIEQGLTEQVELQTSAAPAAPAPASSTQIQSSVVIRISSFSADKWTFLYDRRLRTSIASRISFYCGSHRTDCQITGSDASFTISHVQRTSTTTPSNAGDSIDYSFYVNYPSQSTTMDKQTLASIVKLELEAMQFESALFFSLQTVLELPTPTTPTAAQSNSTVEINILNQQDDEWHVIQDNQLRSVIATQVATYCAANLVVCGVTSSQTAFDSTHVTRIASSPVQAGDNIIYTFFVDYPSGSGPIQRNLLAGIIAAQLNAIQTTTSLGIEVVSSTLAANPPAATLDQNSKAVKVSAANTEADEWSAIQDEKFRHYIAQALAAYCTASDAQNQECELPGNDALFTRAHVQRVPGSPTQNGTAAEIDFYVNYPGGGTVSQEILILILNQMLPSVGTNTGLALTLLTTPPPVVQPPTPAPDNSANAVNVILKDFQADQWSFRDALFRQNMAEAITEFCKTSTYHRDICNISDADINGFSSANIQRLPNSPTQNGSNSILSFYATLPVSGGSLAKSVLATIFTALEEKILSISSVLENSGDSLSSAVTPVLTNEQNENKVPLTILNFESTKVTTLEITDIKVTVAAIMNRFCFSPAGDVCGLLQTARRKKRAAENRFAPSDVIVDSGSITSAGNSTVVNTVVNEPGKDTPLPLSIVEDAIGSGLQDDSASEITNLKLAVVNTPVATNTQKANAISVTLTNQNTNEWSLRQDISFRNNMSEAIKSFCGRSNFYLSLCNLTRGQLNAISFLNVQIMPSSPTQVGNNAELSFFVNVPSGTMAQDLLQAIFSQASPPVISQPSYLNVTTSQDPTLTAAQTENLVPLTISPTPSANQDVRFDVQVSIANQLNAYCRNNTGAQICPNSRNFTKDDVLVKIDPSTGDVSFVVNNPDTPSPVPASGVQDAISGGFTSAIHGLTFTVPSRVSDDEEVDWPLILGLSIGGAVLLLFVLICVVVCVVRHSKPSYFKEHPTEKARSGYSEREWQFDRESPYSGSPFASIDAIPGFDEDGLPSAQPQDSRP